MHNRRPATPRNVHSSHNGRHKCENRTRNIKAKAASHTYVSVKKQKTTPNIKTKGHVTTSHKGSPNDATRARHKCDETTRNIKTKAMSQTRLKRLQNVSSNATLRRVHRATRGRAQVPKKVPPISRQMFPYGTDEQGSRRTGRSRQAL